MQEAGFSIGGGAAQTGVCAAAGGRFLMGSDSDYLEERPAHPVRVDALQMDAAAVTNAPFAAFVQASGDVAVPAARHAQMVDTGMGHIGFRRVRRDAQRQEGDDRP